MKKDKRIISLIISASVAIVPVCAFAGDISCDVTGRNITLSGNIETDDEYISGFILPKDMADAEVSAENINSGDVIAFSTAGDEGTFSKTIGLPENLKSGEYIACVYENTERIVTGFIYCSDNLDNLSAQMADMTDEQIRKAVADNKELLGIPEEYCEDFASYLTASEKSLKDAYGEAVVVCLMKNGELESAVRLYGAEYGIDYESGYSALKDSVKANLADMIQKETITDIKSDYDILLKSAMLAGIETKDELKDFVLSLDADFEDYNELSDSDKKSVINKLFNNMPSDIKALTERFDAYCAEAKSDGSGSSGSGGGSSSGSGGGRGSGGAAAGTHMGTVSGVNTSVENVSFGDTEAHWAREYIEALSSQKIVSGYENGMFYPDRNVTRAEFSKMVAVAMGIAPDSASASAFADVSDTDWHKPYVTAMAKNGIITGYNGYFRPDDYISREDMAVIICRTLTQKGVKLDKTVEFDDISSASDYAVDAIAKLGGSKIINGSDNKYRPKAMSTRAETAAVIARILTAF